MCWQAASAHLAAGGTPGGAFIAPLLFTGTCDTQVFTQWLAQCLCPQLTAADVVITDNATLHKQAATARLIAATGAQLLYLPPYSPDLNPIEPDFAALKKRREYNAEASLDEIVKAYHS